MPALEHSSKIDVNFSDKLEKRPPGGHTEGSASDPLGGRQGGVLDTRTKSATPPSAVDESTGEIFTSYDPTLKWQLQAVARVAMGVFDPSVSYKQGHRIRICCRHIRGDWHEVQIRGNADRRAYFAGLMMCGSVWVCPVCAAKVQAYRAAEVRRAIDVWKDQGGVVLMMTLTVPHGRSDSLQGVLSGFNQAMRKFTNGAPMQRLKKAYKLSGSIKGLEVTWGSSNGWHPHAHVLLFLEDMPDMEQLERSLFERWISAAARAGFGKPSIDAFSLQDGGAVKSYVTKMGTEYLWNSEHELVKSHSKSAGGGRFSPFDFLRANLDESTPLFMGLFREFGEAFHGKHQLVWSNGLKKQLLGSEGLSDEQIADSIGELDPIWSHIPQEDWVLVRRHNLQGGLLRAAEEFGKAGVEHLISEFRI